MISICAISMLVFMGGCSADPAASPSASTDGSVKPSDAGAAGDTFVVPDPKTIGTCASLAPAGTWENVTPPGNLGNAVGVDGGLGDAIGISVDPFATGGLYVAMHRGGNGQHFPTDGLYKSIDCGSTWSQQINIGTNGDTAAQGSWTSLVFDPIKKNIIYVAPIYGAGGIFKSVDGGVNWTQLFPPESDNGKVVEGNFFDNIAIDPTDHLHLLAGTHGACNAPYGPACLAETHDGGTTWKFVKLPIPMWGENAGPWIVNETTWFYAGGGIFLTTDNGGTFSPNIAPKDAPFYSGGEEQIHPLPRAPDGTLFLASAEGVVQSSDGALTRSLLKNSPTSTFGLTIGGGSLYASDKRLLTATLSDPTSWSEIKMPPGLEPNQDCFYLDYDNDFHLLYVSCYGGGVWRMVSP